MLPPLESLALAQPCCLGSQPQTGTFRLFIHLSFPHLSLCLLASTPLTLRMHTPTPFGRRLVPSLNIPPSHPPQQPPPSPRSRPTLSVSGHLFDLPLFVSPISCPFFPSSAYPCAFKKVCESLGASCRDGENSSSGGIGCIAIASPGAGARGRGMCRETCRSPGKRGKTVWGLKEEEEEKKRERER